MKCVLTFLFVFVAVNHINMVTSFTCTKKDIFGNTKYFNCPQPEDTFDEIYCCGTENFHYCCNSQDLSVNVNSIGLVVGILVSVIIFIIIIVVISCFCCSCCILAKRRRQQGMILSSSPNVFGTTTMVAQTASTSYPPYQPHYPPSSGYPVYPPANTGYPPSNMDKPPPYPITGQQPAYNQGY